MRRMPLSFMHGEEVSPLTLTNRRVRRPCFDICEVYDSFENVRSALHNTQSDYCFGVVFCTLCRLSQVNGTII